MANRKSQTFGRRLGRALLHMLDVAILAVIGVGLYMALVGIPDWLVRRWLVPKPEQAYALEVRHLRYSPLRGFIADDVRIFQRKQIGPAVLEARRVELGINLYEGVLGRPMVSGITIQNGLVRPEMLARKPAPAAQTPLALRVVLQNVEIEHVWINALEGELAGDAEAWRLDHIDGVLQHEERTLEARGSLARGRGGDLSGEGSAEGDPAVLIPIFDATRVRIAPKIIRNFQFPESMPRADWSFHVPGGAPQESDVRIQLWLENPVYRGVDAMRAEGLVQLSWSKGTFTAEIRPLTIVREEGVARGGLTIRQSQGSSTLEFDTVSGIDPVAAAQITGVFTNTVRTAFRFAPPYTMAGNGLVDLRNPRNVALDADLAFGLLGAGKQDFRDCTFRLHMAGGTNAIEDLKASWFGGTLEGRAEWRRALANASNVQYRMEMAVADANFNQIAITLMEATPNEYAGRLAGRVTVDGLTGKAQRETLQGGGELIIKRGRIFMLPIFGGLSDYLRRTIPGLNLLIGQSDVRADFTMGGGRMRTEKLLLEGDILSLMGKGSYGFDGSLDFDVQLTFLKSHTLMGKIIRVPTYIFSKLFEFKLTGTRAAPRWYPINFSKDLWQKRSGEGNKDGAAPEEEDPMMEWDVPW